MTKKLPFNRKSLFRANSGLATVEFALILPLFLTMGLFGVDVAYMAVVNSQVSQTALSLADNASRLGQTDNSSVTPTVTEADINSIFAGAMRAGKTIDLTAKGRIILSSIERDSSTGKQYIHWQRCQGSFSKYSSYGNDTNRNGLAGTPITGVGSASNQITADAGSSIMVAEVYYDYKGFFSGLYPTNQVLRKEAAFIIRDDRNLTPGVTGTRGATTCT